jgi:hypothetical protein
LPVPRLPVSHPLWLWEMNVCCLSHPAYGVLLWLPSVLSGLILSSLHVEILSVIFMETLLLALLYTETCTRSHSEKQSWSLAPESVRLTKLQVCLPPCTHTRSQVCWLLVSTYEFNSS